MIPDIQKFITFQQIFGKKYLVGARLDFVIFVLFSVRQKDRLDVTNGPENLNSYPKLYQDKVIFYSIQCVHKNFAAWFLSCIELWIYPKKM